jgi:hypothetical protein
MLDVPLQAAAYRFAKGHRIRLMVSGADVLNAWPTPDHYTATIHYGPQQPSRLELPMVPAATLPAPAFRSSEFAPLPQDQIPAPDSSVTRDLVAGTLSCNYRTNSGVGVNGSSYTVSLHRPEQASVVSDFRYDVVRPDWSCQVYAQCTTHSDADGMHHAVETKITVNGEPYWRKSWATRVPRLGW